MEDKRQSWEELLEKSYDYPEGLSEVEYRLEKRIGKRNRKRNAVYSTFSAAAAVFVFVILVNSSAAFAGSISEIPLIGKLAEFVRFDRSLSNAIENDYVQKVDLVAWNEQDRLLLPYVIADESNLVLFFRLPEEFELSPDDWVQIQFREMRDGITGEPLEGFSCSTYSMSAEGRDENNGFIQQYYHFSEGTLPMSIELAVDMVVDVTQSARESEMAEMAGSAFEERKVKELGTFTFRIHFEELAKPKVYQLNEDYTILGQRMTIEEMKVYPTGTEVIFLFPDENTAWIKGLDLAVEQDGEIVLKGNHNGLSATSDDKKMAVFIESNYFDSPKEQKLLIQAIRILNKKEEYITVDLNDKTITPEIAGMELIDVSKNQGTATLLFHTKVSEDDNFGIFSSEYQDTEGNLYQCQEFGFSNINSVMETRIAIEPPLNGKVILRRSLTPKVPLERPILIDLPVQP